MTHTKAGIISAVCADILNDVEQEVFAAGYHLDAAAVHSFALKLASVRNALAKVATDEGVPPHMIYKAAPE